jgi:hypothetical protein
MRVGLGRSGVAALAAGAALSPGAAEAAGGVPGSELSLLWGVPFVGVLQSIALMPLFAAHLWHHHYGKIAAFWAVLLLVPLAATFGSAPPGYEFAHVMVLEYVPFIALLRRCTRRAAAFC